jgi:hypothetical protein
LKTNSEAPIFSQKKPGSMHKWIRNYPIGVDRVDITRYKEDQKGLIGSI